MGGEKSDDDVTILRFGPPKRRSGSRHVKSVTRGDQQDDADAIPPPTVDGNIFIFVIVNLFLFF